MAVSKNFVVKNGLEVGTNTLVVDHQNLHVGIGTTIPMQALDVRGDVRFTDGAQTNFFDVSGISTFRNDVNIGVAGSVLHADVNNGFIGIGSAIPRFALDVRSGAGVTLAAAFDKSISAPGLTAPTINTDYLVSVASTTGSLHVFGHSGTSIGVGTDDPSQLLHLESDDEFEILLKRGGTSPSESRIQNNGNLLKLTNNVNGIQFITGTSLENESLYIEQSGNIGFGTTNPNTNFDFHGDINITGVSTFGQNIVANGNIEGDNSTNIININRITAAGGQFTGNITPTTGEGIEIFVPTSGVGQVQSYDRVNTHWDILRFKGLNIDFHTQVGSGPGAITTERMVLSQGGVLSVGSSFSVNQAGVVTATSFHGEGQIGVGSEGTFIGAGVTMVDFKSSSGNNTVDVKSGIATVTVTTGVSLGLVIALGS